MRNNLNSKLVLTNDSNESSILEIFPDASTSCDFVGFASYCKGNPVKFTDEGGGEEELFYLDKFNVGCLIDYLSRIYEGMRDIKHTP